MHKSLHLPPTVLGRVSLAQSVKPQRYPHQLAPSQPWQPEEIRYNLRGIAGVAHDSVVAIDVDGGWNMANLAVSYVWDRD